MKRTFTLIAFFIFLVSTLSFASNNNDRERIENGVKIFPQTNAPVLNKTVPQSEIDREQNPEPPGVDNSQSTKDWAKIVEARKSGNEELYFRLSREYTQKYPEQFINNGRNTFNAPQDVPVQSSKQIPFETDWIQNGDNIVSHGTVPNPGIFERNLRLRIDSLGTQYTAYITDNRDSLVIYRSTNNGQNWSLWKSLNPGGSTKWHSFDMFITDTTGGHVLGFIGCRTPNVSSFEGQAYFFYYKDDGTFSGATLITPTGAGRGNISPSIVSDGRDWSPGATYWYVVFRNVNGTTGVGDSAVISFSTDWGQAWSTPRRVRNFDDYDLSVNYNYRADSIYVLLTNALTPTNPNLRLMRISLTNLTSGVYTWGQFNPANTADPEFHAQLAVNRDNNDMGLIYTRTIGGINKVYYDYRTSSNYWNSPTPVFTQPEAQILGAIDCNIGQWAWRITYQVATPSWDTIIYASTFTMNTGFVGRTVVNQNDITRQVAPSVAGYINPTSGGGVAFAGFAGQRIYYDNSSIVTNINPTGNETPEVFSLSQNFPNPFNPETQINFTLPSSGLVKLVVYDVLGKEVATLVNENKIAGSYTVNFNAAKLTSGVYFYKLSSGEFSDVKRMMLIK